MRNNAQLMSTAPSFFVWQKFGTKTEHHSLRQVIAPSFLHVTPKYYYLRLVRILIPLIVFNLVWAQPGNLVWSEKRTAVSRYQITWLSPYKLQTMSGATSRK